MSNLAIIPARGGSKRIPRKNIKPFLGKPIISYSIEMAIQSRLFDEVMVSTDDDEIADIAKKCGAKVPFKRRESSSGDFATTTDVITEVLKDYANSGMVFSNVCCIYPAAPLIKINHLERGLNSLLNQSFFSVLPVVEFSYPIWRALETKNDERLTMIWPKFKDSRSQDLTNAYHDAGQWYWFKPDKIVDTLFTENTGYILLKEEEVQDIDNITDWKLAELKYNLTKGEVQN
ncbi:MAG: pseudaminic acid cytidylyltransferase [Imperialibacter sp.]|uniref:pseudaminic acid cytidylyltransferase n=1 Tax=Imperialibacter sp. TaxID=2038411 RepID=UPI0032EE6888